jgi:hypothetical protein
VKIQITFKSGAQIAFDSESLETARNRVTNNLERLTWHTPEDATAKLHGIYDLAEIVAIVVLYEPATPQADAPVPGVVHDSGCPCCAGNRR